MAPSATRAAVRRKRPVPHGSRRYTTLAALLDAQPKGLVRNPKHRLLWDQFMASDRLKCLRISRRCYRLLNEASVPPENLKNFYQTYRLPEDPFFPLFLAVKSEWFAERILWQEQREKVIMTMMRRLPDHRRRAMRILAEYERKHHPASDHPIFENQLFPTTKKRAAIYAALDENGWYHVWREHLLRLSWRYRDIPPLFDRDGRPTYSARILSVLVLRCHRIDRKEIIANFRVLSKQFHPDRGGDAISFRRLKEARDLLLSD
jgi:hypothetical protein